MATIKESALAYEGENRMKNIVELAKVSTALEILSKDVKLKTGEVIHFEYIEVNEEQYRIPASVLKSLKMILEDNPNLKEFKVKKTGTGLDTEYTVIPLN